jgi:hypothetical protein
VAWFEVHTDESVHGVYHVEADDAEAARKMFEDPEGLRSAGEQRLYEAYSAEVQEVKPL